MKYKVTKSDKYVNGGSLDNIKDDNEITVYGNAPERFAPKTTKNTNVFNVLENDASDMLGQQLYDIENTNLVTKDGTSNTKNLGNFDYNLNSYSPEVNLNSPTYKTDFSAGLYENKANPLEFAKGEYATQEPVTPQSGGNNINWDKVGNIAGETARYAPIAMSGAQALFGDFDPEVTNYARMSPAEKLQANKISETQYDALFNSQYNKTRGDIINTSGGSGAAARANILGAGVNNARGKASIINKIIERNLGEESRVDQYNAANADRVNQANVGIANQEMIANEQNKAAANTAKNEAWLSFIDNISKVGTEQFLKGQSNRANPNVKG